MENLPFREFEEEEASDIQNSGTLSEQEIIGRICLFRSQNVGPVTYRNLLKRYKTSEKALEALPHLATRGGRRAPLSVYSKDQAIQELEHHERIGAKIIVDGDGVYPKHLRNIDEAPPILSLHGRKDLLHQKAVGIVGARNCSLNGKKITFKLAQDLGAQGFVIASGLARGIDGQAHQGAIDTGTIGVIAGGIDKVYPTEHLALFHRLREQGAILAESPIGTEPQSTLFPRRNRLISALSQGVIIVEAALQSGSLITARYAVEQNRDVFVVPGSPMDPRYRGSNALIRNGATLICDARDVMDVLDAPFRDVMREAAFDCVNDTYGESVQKEINDGGENLQESDAKNLSQEILQHLSSAPISLDELLRACPYAFSHVMSVLLELELAGAVTRHPGNQLST